MRQFRIALLVSSLTYAFAAEAGAQTAPDLLAIEMPSNVIRVTQNSKMFREYKCYLPNQDGSQGKLLGAEFYKTSRISKDGVHQDEDKPVIVELYAGDNPPGTAPILHGVKKEWHQNGKLKSEKPFRMGTMDGQFQCWDEQGKLVACSQINNGNGTLKIYDSKGRLQELEQYRNNLQDGWNFHFWTESDFGLYWYDRGHLDRVAYRFGPQKVNSIIFFKNQEINGPRIFFYPKISPAEQQTLNGLSPGITFGREENKWYIHSILVTPDQYAASAAKDKSLPPYYADSDRYLEYVTPEIHDLAMNYINAPLVVIPLRFDKEGAPVLKAKSKG